MMNIHNVLRNSVCTHNEKRTVLDSVLCIRLLYVNLSEACVIVVCSWRFRILDKPEGQHELESKTCYNPQLYTHDFQVHECITRVLNTYWKFGNNHLNAGYILNRCILCHNYIVLGMPNWKWIWYLQEFRIRKMSFSYLNTRCSKLRR